jgi:hypothetical protein
MRVNYKLSCLHYILINRQPIKNVFAWIWPNSDRWLVNPCALPSIGQTWVLVSNDAAFEMGIEKTAYGV